MTAFFVQQYVEEFSDLCEKLHWDELDYVLPKMIGIFSDIQNEKFIKHWILGKKDFVALVESRAFDSAIFAMIPNNLHVAFYRDDVLNFEFHEQGRTLQRKSYRSSNKVFSLGLLSAYLRYILDESKNSHESGVVVVMRDHLSLSSGIECFERKKS